MSLSWSARNALRLYPQSWRDEYEQEMIGTLLDVADGDRPATGEVAVLAARGAWMRARSSVIFWIGVAIVALMIGAPAAHPDGYLTERYWTSMLVLGGFGLQVALPLAGIAIALRSRTAFTWRKAGTDAAAVAVFVAVGYLAAIAGILIASGWPVTTNAALGVPATYLLLTAAVLAVGLLLNYLFPRFIAAPVAGLALLAWFFLPFWAGTTPASWFDTSGYSTLHCCDTLYDTPVTWLTNAFAAFVILASLVIIAIKKARGWLWTSVPIAFIALLSLFAYPMSWATSQTEPRSRAELVCAGTGPEICLWPEQEAQGGELVRSSLTGAYAAANDAGIPTEPVIGAGMYEEGETGLHYTGIPTRDSILVEYAYALTWVQSRCSWIEGQDQPSTLTGYQRLQQSAQYATALIMGADPIAALPSVYDADRSYLTASETTEFLNVRDRDDAAAVLAAWAVAEPDSGCRSIEG